jgi:hypothetical protein
MFRLVWSHHQAKGLRNNVLYHVLQVTCVSSSGIACGFTLDVLLYKNPDFEGIEGSKGSKVMLGWIVLLMRMNEILFVSMDAW